MYYLCKRSEGGRRQTRASSYFLYELMILKERVEQIIEDYIATVSDIFLVEVSVQPGNRIVVMIDSDARIDLDCCIALSRHIESKLDREEQDFELEVGSVGITSAIRMERQWRKHLGREVEILLNTGVKEKGIVQDVMPEGIVFAVVRRVLMEGKKRKQDVTEELRIAFVDIKIAKPVIKI